MASSRSNIRSRQPSGGQLRIIGGLWRGRKLEFAAAKGLRPTADRVRETLFNWLVPVINGARCADLFAGSGALGLEALSRGAAHCDFVDVSPPACQQISRHITTLKAVDQSHCHCSGAVDYLNTAREPLDLVFLDPPFGQKLVLPTCRQLVASKLLAPGSLVYIELSKKEALTDLPADWEVHRQKTAGDVTYGLYTPT